jgi:hypothetical protein
MQILPHFIFIKSIEIDVSSSSRALILILSLNLQECYGIPLYKMNVGECVEFQASIPAVDEDGWQ